MKLRQTYVRVGKQALLKQSRYAAARQGRRAQKQTRMLRTYLRRVIRDVERKLQPMPEAVAQLLKSAKQIHQQQKQDKGKCYSIHAPEVECITKGKAHKPHEFGCKVVLTTTNVSNWIVGIAAQHGNQMRWLHSNSRNPASRATHRHSSQPRHRGSGLSGQRPSPAGC